MLDHHWTVVWKNRSHVWSLQKMSYWNLIRSIKDKDIKSDLMAVCERKQLPEELGSSNGAILFCEDKYAIVGYEVRWCLFDLSVGREVGSSLVPGERSHKEQDLYVWFGAYDRILKGSLLAVRDHNDLWYGAVGYRLGDFGLKKVGDAYYESDADPVILLQEYVEQSLPGEFKSAEKGLIDSRFSHIGGMF